MSKETEIKVVKKQKGRVKGSKNLPKELVHKVRDMWRAGIYTNVEIAAKYGVHPTTVRTATFGWDKDIRRVMKAMAQNQATLAALDKEVLEEIAPIVAQNVRDLNLAHKAARTVLLDALENKPKDMSPADSEKFMRMVKEFKEITGNGPSDIPAQLSVTVNNADNSEKSTVLVLPTDDYKAELQTVEQEKVVEGEIV